VLGGSRGMPARVQSRQYVVGGSFIAVASFAFAHAIRRLSSL
jgi:hypothetical protein